MSSVFLDADLPSVTQALQIHTNRDFCPAWNLAPVQFYWTPAGRHAPADHQAIYLLDNADVAGELGVHDKTTTGMALGKVFVKTTLANGGSVSNVLCHESDEMQVDPRIGLLAQKGSGSYAYETDDAVERDQDGYDVDVPANFTGGPAKVRMSNFCLPAWFDEVATVGPYDFMGQLTAPFTLRPGGYANVLTATGWTQIFGADTPAAERMAARPRPGSRRSRRSIPKSEWQLSSYSPGTEAHPAEATT